MSLFSAWLFFWTLCTILKTQKNIFNKYIFLLYQTMVKLYTEKIKLNKCHCK